MLRKLMLGAVMALAVTSSAFAASARWQALGNEHRFMLDTSNYGIYPGRMFMFSDALWIIPNAPPTAEPVGLSNMLSGVLVTSGNNAYAIHYNLPGTVAFGALRAGLNAAGGNLQGLVGKLQPMPDLFWAHKSGDRVLAGRVVLGVASSQDAAKNKTSAMSLDLAGGVTQPISMGDLDLGVRLALAGFSDKTQPAEIKSTGGMGISVDGRLIMNRGEGVKLIPIAAVAYLKSPTVDGVSEASNDSITVGLGYNKSYPDKRMLILGAVVDANLMSNKVGSASSAKATRFTLTYLGGYEMPLNAWLIARGGANAKMMVTTGDNPAINGTGSQFYYNFGARTIYHKFLVDAIFTRGIFHRGPYIASGSAYDWASNICLTYLFGATH